MVEPEVVHSSKGCNPARGKSRIGVRGDQRVDGFAVVEIVLVILRDAQVAAQVDQMSRSKSATISGCRRSRVRPG